MPDIVVKACVLQQGYIDQRRKAGLLARPTVLFRRARVAAGDMRVVVYSPPPAISRFSATRLSQMTSLATIFQ